MAKDKKDKVDPPKNRGGGILIDPALMGSWKGVRKKDWLDRELEEEEKVAERQMRKMRIEEAKARRRKRIVRLEKELEELEGGEEVAHETRGVNMAMARELSKLPDDEKQKVIQTYAMIKQADSGGGDMTSWLPMLIGFSRENPDASKNDMLVYLEAMNKMIQMNMEMQKGTQPKQGENSLEYIKLVKELFQDSLKKPLEDMEQRLQPRMSPFEQILLNPELHTRAKEMGMFGKPQMKQGGASELDLKLEEMRQTHDLRMKELDLNQKKMLMDQKTKQDRNQNLLQALLPLSGLLAGPANEKMRQLGQQTGRNMPSHNPNQNPVQPDEQEPETETAPAAITCDECGYTGVEKLPYPIPEEIKCPACGATLVGKRSNGSGQA